MPKGFVLLVWILVSLTFVSGASAQLEKGTKELSFAAAFMGVKESDQDIETAFNLSVRFGYLITREFEIEPEVIFSAYEGGDPGFILSANFLYNLSLPEASNAIPFFLIGIGRSNSVHFFNQMNLGDTKMDYTILNLGLGSKFFLNDSAALRFEYRFQRFFAEELRTPHFTYDRSISYHNFAFGMTVLLK
jgi:hypothetical protein